MTPSPQQQRLREYERWQRLPGPSALFMRWAMGPLGMFFVNSPLFRLPEELFLHPRQRLLDIGCGRGAMMRMLHSRVRFERPPVGIDFSREVLRLADRDERGAGRPSRLARASATALPFSDATFDLVTCGHVVKHLADEELFVLLLELRRVLADGGLALIWDFAPTGNPRLDAWNERVLSTATTQSILRSTRALLQAAELAGFEFCRDAKLRPFLFPPIPRASVLIGRPPGRGEPDAPVGPQPR